MFYIIFSNLAASFQRHKAVQEEGFAQDTGTGFPDDASVVKKPRFAENTQVCEIRISSSV